MSAMGMSRINPPAKIKQTINAGIAIAIITAAIILNVPHVIFTASPMAFAISSIAKIEMIISSN